MLEEIGSSVRRIRESQGWSQFQLAAKIPISQKQISRIENQQVVGIARHTLIRLAEVLRDPIATGEVNRWLFLCGYRPLVCPRLPLPANASELMVRFDPYPAALLDVGGYFRAYNQAMRRLLATFALRPSLEKSVVSILVAALRSTPPLVSVQEVAFMARRLLLQWSLNPDEAWATAARNALADELGGLFDTIVQDFRPELECLTLMPVEFNVQVPHFPSTLTFFLTEVLVSHRPDLGLYVLYPISPSAKEWCQPSSRASVST